MEEAGLLGQLGINWKLFLSQAVNFFILLLVLHKFVYKPLLKVIQKRNETIAEGIRKAEQADVRLKEIDHLGAEKLKSAEQEAVSIIHATQEKAKSMDAKMQKEMEEKQKNILAQIEKSKELSMQESQKQVVKEASELVKKFLIKTVGLKPDAIDGALIKKAVDATKNEV